MSEIKNSNSKLIFLLDRLFYAVLIVCALKGGYTLFQEYKVMTIDIATMSEEQRGELARALFLSGQSVPEKYMNK